MNFRKMHGLGNDFVILDQRGGREALAPAQITHICDRRHGVGCDQLIIMEPSENADLFMRIYNGDGSESEACGNATRCVAHIYMSEQSVDGCTIETIAGLLLCRMVGDLVEVDMGAPVSIEDVDLSIRENGEPVSVNMGNPHCVFFVDDALNVDLGNIGPVVEHHTLFPDRTNVEFAQIIDQGNIRLRVWERGAGVTLACGSGACATAVAAVHRGLTDRKVDIEMDGGVLTLEHRESDGHVLMTGPVAYAFAGVL